MMDNKQLDQRNKLVKFKYVLRSALNRVNLFQKDPSNRKWISRLASLGWLLLFAFILWGGWRYREEIIPYLINIRVQSLLVAIFFFFLAIASVILGWILITDVFIYGLKPRTHIYIYCITLAGRRIPGTVWYIGGRVLFYKKLGFSGFNISMASIIEIIILIVSGCIISLVVFPFGLKFPTGIMVLLALGVLLGLVPLQPRILAGLLKRLGYPLERPLELKLILKWLSAYSLTWIAGGLMIYFLVDAFHPLTINNLFFILGAWAISGVAGTLTIFLPSSFGISDISLAVFLSVLLPLPVAIAIALISRFSQSIIEVLISVSFYYFIHDPDVKAI